VQDPEFKPQLPLEKKEKKENLEKLVKFFNPCPCHLHQPRHMGLSCTRNAERT
jgi:hypothetical protein